MIRTAWRVVAAILLTALLWSEVAAQDEGPSMDVEAGIDGYCRRGHWCAIRIILSNEGADIQGEAQVVLASPGSGSDNNVYSVPVSLPSHSRKAYFTYMLPPTWGGGITVRLVADNEAIASQTITVRYLEEGDRLYGIVSSSPSDLNFLGNLEPAGGSAAVAHLDLQNLPPQPLGWEPLDVLVLDDSDTTDLTPDQRDAMEMWLALGGHLVVAGGVGDAETSAGVSSLLPVDIETTRTVDDLDELGRYLDVPVLPGPYMVTEATLTDGHVLIEQDDLILLARRRIGAGTVDFLAFNASLNPFSEWDHTLSLWQLIVTGDPVGHRQLSVVDGWTAQAAISAIPGLEPAPASYVFGFLLLYTVLIGPANYLILRKLDRRDLAWVTIPAIIAGFVALAYITGFMIRGHESVIHRLALVHVPEGMQTGQVTQVVGIFSPRRARQDVRVEAVGIRGIPDSAYGDSLNSALHLVQENSVSTLTGLAIDVGGVRSFIAEGHATVEPPSADLHISVGSGTKTVQVSGTIHNGGLGLRDAYLVIGQGRYLVGSLEPNQTIAVQGMLQPIDQGYLSAAVYNPRSTWETGADSQRYQFLEATFEANLAHLDPGAYLVGWTDQAPLEVSLDRHQAAIVDLALYAFKLPAELSSPDGTVIIPPSLMTQEAEEVLGGSEVRPNYISIFAGSSVTLRFTVWPEAMVSDISRMTLFLSPPDHYDSSVPDVEMWSWDGESWDVLPIGWGSNTIPDPDTYIHPSGIIRVRLTTTGYLQLESVDITIEGQR